MSAHTSMVDISYSTKERPTGNKRTQRFIWPTATIVCQGEIGTPRDDALELFGRRGWRTPPPQIKVANKGDVK